jgi:hypothetical protein
VNLDSVRQLKQALGESVLAGLTAAVAKRAALGGSVRAMDQPRPTIALGVVPRQKGEFVLAVRIQERSLEGSREVELIRRQAKGEVDVRTIGLVTKRAAPWYQKRQRPLRIGCSVGHVDVTAGTLGCFVRPRGSQTIAVLSNNHVLASENRAKAGDPILQPGALDGGQNPGNVVATLLAQVKLRKAGVNEIDAAVAALKEGIEADLSKITGLGKLKGVGGALLDEGTAVAKLGRTTGLTRGRVTAFELDNVWVEYDLGDLRFDDQLEIEGAGDKPFSDGGDSGSLIVDKDLLGVALLFAGTDQGGANGQGLTYANPLGKVLAKLKIELAI